MRDYHPFNDYEQIFKWFQERGMKAPTHLDLPKIGRIVPKVAAGFLVQTDTASAVLDFFITNPKASQSDRSQAIDSIVKELMQDAKDLGFRRVRCDSQIDTIKKRAVALGFRCSGDHTVFCKEI